MLEFYKTQAGREFFHKLLPELIQNIGRVANALSTSNAVELVEFFTKEFNAQQSTERALFALFAKWKEWPVERCMEFFDSFEKSHLPDVTKDSIVEMVIHQILTKDGLLIYENIVKDNQAEVHVAYGQWLAFQSGWLNKAINDAKGHDDG